jgi:hypothetical protein
MENPPIQPIVSNVPQFMIVPTGYSATSSVVIILVLFILYMIFIGYIASYKLKFYPNLFMFWNFLTSGNDVAYQTEFENYVRTVMADTNAQITQTQIGVLQPSNTSESFVSGKGSKKLIGNTLTNGFSEIQPMLRSWYTNTQMLWNQLMLKSFVRGKTIKVTRVGNMR